MCIRDRKRCVACFLPCFSLPWPRFGLRPCASHACASPSASQIVVVFVNAIFNRARGHAYTSDKTVSDNAMVVIELNVIGMGCNNSTRECAMERIVHYPNDTPSVGQLKTLIALDNDDEAIYARSLRSENDDQLLQMDLCVKITDNTRHMLSTVDTVFAAFEPRTPDES